MFINKTGCCKSYSSSFINKTAASSFSTTLKLRPLSRPRPGASL